MHPFQKHREDKTAKARVRHILKADGGGVKPTVGDARFMMRYDANAGGPRKRSDMAAAQRISDAVPRDQKKSEE